MSAPALVVTDMDGTLLSADGAVSARNAAALRRAREAGARVVVATGRPVWWLDPIREAGVTGTVVCMNGALVYDLDAEQVVTATPLQPHTLVELSTALHERLPEAALAVERLSTVRVDSWAEQHYDHPWAEGSFGIQQREELLAVPAIKVLVRHGSDSASLAAVVDELGIAGITTTWSTDAGLVEVMSAGVNKGATLAALARSWGIDPRDAVAFGDMPNDVEMLRWAGHGYAMASGHPDAISAAGQQAPHFDDDGVAQVLEARLAALGVELS